MKIKLTEADKFYIKENWKTSTIEQLVSNTGCKEKPIKEYIEILTNAEIETLQAVGKPLFTKGSTIMTEQASIAADDFAKLPKPSRNTSGHVHHCKEKPKK